MDSFVNVMRWVAAKVGSVGGRGSVGLLITRSEWREALR
jgi:hypothetical protein